MTAIRLECETCGVGLRVRDEGFIGQVHACPRCGSMVQILATAPAATAEASPVDSDASDVAESVAPPQVMLGLSETLAAEEPADGTAAESLDADAAPAAEAATASLAQWAPLAVTATALLATAGLVATWALRGPAEESSVAATPSIEIGGSTESASSTPADEDDFGAQGDAPPTPAISEPGPTPAAAEPPTTAIAPAAVASPPVPEPIASESIDPAPVASPAPLAEEADATPAESIDPLTLDPDALELVLVRSPGSVTAPSIPPSDTAAPPPEDDPPPSPTDEEMLDKQLLAAARRGAGWARWAPTDRELALEPAAPRLAATLPGIDLRQAPLDEALTLLGELAGAPVTIAPRALFRAGVRADRPIDVRGGGQSFATLLEASLGSARLGFEVDGPHTRVVRRGATVRRLVPHRLNDLACDAPDAFVAMLSQLGIELPTDADVTAPKTPLDLTMGEHCDLLVLCETLRVARSLPTVSKYPVAALPVRSAWLAMSDRLSRRATFSFVTPTELRDAVGYWRRALETPVLIDWPSLAAKGTSPTSELTGAATNRPWAAALDGVLRPLGLGWAPIHGGAVWIASAERVARERSIALYPGDEAEPAMRIAAGVRDPVSGAAIVLASPAEHRQIAAELGR